MRCEEVKQSEGTLAQDRRASTLNTKSPTFKQVDEASCSMLEASESCNIIVSAEDRGAGHLGDGDCLDTHSCFCMQARDTGSQSCSEVGSISFCSEVGSTLLRILLRSGIASLADRIPRASQHDS